ncbi:MAG: hypothetical protein NT118_01615 [Lentisphaerae bacterium]|nr:hypothetical protein [Lentisphaerota bacterium]
MPRWLEETKSVTGIRSDSPRCKVLFFAYFQELVDYSLALASVLVGRNNVDMDFAWVPHGGNTETNSLRYPYWKRSVERLPSQPHPYLHLYNPENIVPAPITDEMRVISADQARADVSYILRRERIHIESDPTDRRLYEYRQARNLEAVAKVARLLQQNAYDRVIMANGAITELGAVYRYVAGLGLPVSTFEMWDIAGTIVVSSGAPVMNVDTRRLWERDEPHVMSEERRARVERLIQARSRARATGVAVAYQPTDGLTQRAGIIPPDQVRALLGLSPDRPVVLVCPNVPFDSMFYAERNRNFGTMWEWLVKTIEFLAQRTDCQVIVRSHPSEPQYNSDETTPSLIREFFPSLPAHITVLPAEAPINTYAVMQIADLGLVYASTTGLEMAARGIPVVCGISSQHFNQKGFTIDPESPEEYFSQIERVLHNPPAFRLTPRQIELAWCYADVYFNQWPRPFPWLAGRKFFRDVKAWPITRMLSLEGNEKFGSVFDILLGHESC